MAQFVYTYKTPDNERHEGEIAAKDRDAAFAALRAQGIRAIKVEPKGWETGAGYRGLKKRVALMVGLVCLVLGGVLALFLSGRFSPLSSTAQSTRASNQQSVHPSILHLAAPLARQPILGDRLRIENTPTNMFAYALERYLAQFAEPGRPLPSASPAIVVDPSDLRTALARPLQYAATDFTEYVDLKRIVAGMKRELQNYLDGGGTFAGYQADLVKRQKMEIAYREKAERHLSALLKDADASSQPPSEPPKLSKPSKLSSAYDYWLKANATLKTMGIYELPLPERLRSYQLSIDLDVD